jgi:hypothetical protein
MTSHLANYPVQPAGNEEMLDALQRDAFGYFLHETNPVNGLEADKMGGICERLAMRRARNNI